MGGRIIPFIGGPANGRHIFLGEGERVPLQYAVAAPIPLNWEADNSNYIPAFYYKSNRFLVGNLALWVFVPEGTNASDIPVAAAAASVISALLDSAGLSEEIV